MEFDGGQEDSLLQEILIAGGARSIQQQEAAREAERHRDEELRFGAQHSAVHDRFSFEQWSRPGEQGLPGSLPCQQGDQRVSDSCLKKGMRHPNLFSRLASQARPCALR